MPMGILRCRCPRSRERLPRWRSCSPPCRTGAPLPAPSIAVLRQADMYSVSEPVARLRRKPDQAHVVGQAGVLALGPGVTPSLFRRWLRAARALAAEWAELRGVHRHQLAGTVVRAQLQVGTVRPVM